MRCFIEARCRSQGIRTENRSITRKGLVLNFSGLGRLLAVAVLVIVPAFAAQAADATVGAIVVKYRDGTIPRGLPALPATQRLAAAQALRVAVSELGVTRDGAYRLALDPPLSIDEARSGLNRLRMQGEVLYASAVDLNGAAGSGARSIRDADQQPPIHRLIVKFRDPVTSA